MKSPPVRQLPILALLLLALTACSTQELLVPDRKTGLPEEVRQLIPSNETDWVDACRQLSVIEGKTSGSRSEGIDRMLDLLGLVSALLEKYNFEPEAQKFIETLGGNLMELDMDEIYQLLQPSPDGRGRQLLLHARREGPTYRVSISHSKTPPTLETGDFSSRLRLVPVSQGVLGGLSYNLEGELTIDTGRVNGRQFLQFLVECVRRIELETRPRLGETPGPLPGPLEREDWRLMEGLARAYPATHRWLTSHIDVLDFVDRVPAADKRPNLVRFHAVLAPRAEAFEASYPRIHRFLTQSAFSFDMTSRFLDFRDREVLRQRFSLREQQAVVNFLASDKGRIIPVTPKGKIVPEESFSPLDPLNRVHMEYDIQGSFRGLEVTLQRMPVDISWHVEEKGFTVDTRLRRLPREAKVEGNLFGFVPPWVLALDFDELFKKSILTMTRGRKARGTRILFSWRPLEGRNRFVMLLRTEIPARGMVKMLYRFWRKRFLPSVAPPGDRSRFKNDFYRHIRRDLEAARDNKAKK